MKNVLVAITNRNWNDNAVKLKEGFSKHYETIIIDSKSKEDNHNFDVRLNFNGYYTGLYNEAVDQMRARGKDWLFFIASDVIIDDVDLVVECLEDIPNENIWTWAPSSNGQSHQHCKPVQGNQLRQVPYLEGFCFMSHKDILFDVKWHENHLGYGIDVVLGYETYKKGKHVAVDDRVQIYHTPGTGYNQNTASQLMYRWMGLNGYTELANAYVRAWRDKNFSLLSWMKKN